jgi:phage terminase large subunit GpA-like protein
MTSTPPVATPSLSPQELRKRFPQLARARRIVRRAERRGIRRDPDVRPSQWADRHRMVAEGTSPHPGKWRNSRTPYLVEIMDCLAPGHWARRVTLAKSAQIAGSEMISNVLLWSADAAPAPILVVHPTIEAGRDWTNEKLDPTIESTPRAKRKIAEHVIRGRGGSTLKRKRFPGGSIVITGANSAAGLRQKSIKILICDDFDEFPLAVSGQGDPVGMARARLISFKKTAQDKELDVSTPTILKLSRIWKQFEEGTRARYHVPCPQCGHLQTLKWGGEKEKFGLKFDVEAPHRARYICEEAGCVIEHWQLEAMMDPANGAKWIHAKPLPGREPSYHINALYSPFVTWDDAVKAFLDAKGDTEKLKTFVNLWLGEPWDEKGDAPKAAALVARRETWDLGTIPGPVGAGGPLMIALGADVQANGIFYEVLASGRGWTTWSIEHGFLDGDTSTEESTAWRALDKVRAKRFRDLNGNDRPIEATGVDANYQTDIVVGWCKSRVNCFPLRGEDGLHVPPWLGRATIRERSERGKARRRGPKTFPVGTWQLKARFAGQIKQVQEPDTLEFPPGFCHFSQDWTEEDFEQLLSEVFVRARDRKTGRERTGWHQIGAQNHLLDCRIYAMAMLEKLGQAKKSPAEWEWLERKWLRGEQRDLFGAPDLGDSLIPPLEPNPSASPFPPQVANAVRRPLRRTINL